MKEAGGHKLFLSTKSASGYMGVSKEPSGRFKAVRNVGGAQVYLGTYDTAGEAAVAFAKHAADDGVYPDENLVVAPPWLAAALEQAKDGSVVEEAGGAARWAAARRVATRSANSAS